MDARYYGQVKRFTDHKGYGFITVVGRTNADLDAGVFVGREVFVHHSDISTAVSTYKRLVKGEYVSFNLKRVHRPRDENDLQACDVRGPYGGPLMCDTNVLALPRSEPPSPVVLHNGDLVFAADDDVLI